MKVSGDLLKKRVQYAIDWHQDRGYIPIIEGEWLIAVNADDLKVQYAQHLNPETISVSNWTSSCQHKPCRGKVTFTEDAFICESCGVLLKWGSNADWIPIN